MHHIYRYIYYVYLFELKNKIRENKLTTSKKKYSSDEYITKHHKEAHYRWTNFAKSGGVLNIDHKFI